MVEELGSGFNRLFHYARIYTGNDPIIEDLPIFKFSLKIPFFKSKTQAGLFEEKSTSTVNDTLTDTVSQLSTNKTLDLVGEDGRKILMFCEEPRKTIEIMKFVGYQNKSYFLHNIIYPLINLGLLRQTHPETPNHPNQKYVVVKKS